MSYEEPTRFSPDDLLADRDDTARSLVDMIRSDQPEAVIKELARGLRFPDYKNVLQVCREQDITPDDALVFLGTMTDERGAPVDMRLGNIAGFVLGRFQKQHEIGLRTVPEDSVGDSKKYFVGKFRFMLVQFMGGQPEPGTLAGRLHQPTLPLIEFVNLGATSDNGSETEQKIDLFDRHIMLNQYGKTMYFRLLLQLGNLGYKIAGNDPNITSEDFDLAQISRYKELFQQKLPGLRAHIGMS